MWDRWQKGESLQRIAVLFDRNHSSIQRILAETGGIRPAQRCRSKLVLTLVEREEISRAVVAGHSIRSIATTLGRAPSTSRADPLASLPRPKGSEDTTLLRKRCSPKGLFTPSCDACAVSTRPDSACERRPGVLGIARPLRSWHDPNAQR